MATETMSEKPENEDLVVVYEASPAVAAQVADMLTKEGIDCVITDKANPTGLYPSEETTLASIAVPRDYAPWARSYLRKWEQTCNGNVGKLTKKLGVCFLRSTAITVSAAAAIYVAGLFAVGTAMLLAALWVVAFAVLANSNRIFKSSGKD